MDKKRNPIMIYEELQQELNKSLIGINDLETKNNDILKQKDKLLKELNEIDNALSEELEFLKENSEWEKYSIAFFGETNAGKSTILEALRIIFKEKERQQNILSNRLKQEEFANTYIDKAKEIETDLLKINREETNKLDSALMIINKINGLIELEIDKISNENQELMSNNLNLSKIKEALENKNNELEDKIENLLNEVKELKSINDELDKDNKKLEEKLVLQKKESQKYKIISYLASGLSIVLLIKILFL